MINGRAPCCCAAASTASGGVWVPSQFLRLEGEASPSNFSPGFFGPLFFSQFWLGTRDVGGSGSTRAVTDLVMWGLLGPHRSLAGSGLVGPSKRLPRFKLRHV